jgi:aspartyl protease family protein
MPNKLILIGCFVGAAASVPLIYEANPDYFAGFFESNPEPPVVAGQATPIVRAEKKAPEALQGRKVRIEADQRGHYSADFKLNGRTTDAMVDTGATLVAINETTARRIGIALKQSDFVYNVSTANGTVRAASATIHEIQIGKIYVKDVEAAVLEDKALSGTLVGLSFLQKIRRYHVDSDGMVLEQ